MSKYLGTIKDLEEIVRAFEDPKSDKYVIRTFGYCTECNSVAAYRFSGSRHGFDEKCLKCGASQSGPLGSHKRNLILTDMMVPFAVKEEIDVLHSREKQKAFLLEYLEKFMKDKDLSRVELLQALSNLEKEIKDLLVLQERVSKLKQN